MSEIGEAALHEIVWMMAPLRREPNPEAPLETEALRGESVAIGRGEVDGWVHARLLADGYEGYLPTAALAPLGPAATHCVAVPRTLAYPTANFTHPPIAALTMGARIRIARRDGRYAVTSEGEFLIESHLEPIGSRAPDPVSVAEMFLRAPYLWGGKSVLGIDCSGLVQLALAQCGTNAPRDSHQQEAALGSAVPLDVAPYGLRRGDLLFWPGHVAVARGDGTMIHATAHTMMVVIEEVEAALARIAAGGDQLRSIRRLGI
jgi:cell wall-associated NlpC family hydrolase